MREGREIEESKIDWRETDRQTDRQTDRRERRERDRRER